MKYKLTQEIRELILNFLQHKEIVCSWGISEIEVTSLTISFHACGNTYCGQVEIKRFAAGLCQITLDNRESCLCKQDDVLRQLDGIIENTESYLQSI